MSEVPNPAISVGIIGTDPAALTLALACRLHGLSCHLYETIPEPAQIDPVVELTANATRVLHSLGLRERLASELLEPMYSLTRTARGALLLSQRPLGPFSAARYGATCHLTSRGQLIRLLRNACEAEGVIIRPAGTPITTIDDKTGTLRFADGTVQEHDIIAQAVRLPSSIQTDFPDSRNASAAGEAPPSSTPGAAFTVLRANSSHPGNPQAVQMWCASGMGVIEYPRESGCQLLAVFSGASENSNGKAFLQDRLAGLHPQLRKLADGLLEVSPMTGCNSEPLSQWFNHRRVLLGDACHPLPAHATQAIAAGIEDAWVLATMLERWESTPARGFPDYQRFRRPRVLRIRNHALEQARQQTLSQPREVWLRNFRWSMTSRFLPEIAMSNDDWLFGYDCIKGFV